MKAGYVALFSMVVAYTAYQGSSAECSPFTGAVSNVSRFRKRNRCANCGEL